MEKEIPIGQIGDVDLKLGEGKFTVEAKVALGAAGVGVGASVSIETDKFFDMLAAKIPGKVDDAIFVVLKQVCKSV